VIMSGDGAWCRDGETYLEDTEKNTREAKETPIRDEAHANLSNSPSNDTYRKP
jgi:hypothetical protein